jgi:hypothetical protein
VDGDNGRDDDGLATAAAPVPEDPSPPPGGVDEDEDDDDDYMSDGGLSRLVLFVFGTLIIDNLRGKRGTSQSNLKLNVEAESATIAGLLQRQPSVVDAAPVGIQSFAPIARRPVLKIWRKAFLLVAALPGLGLVGAVVGLLWKTAERVDVVLVPEAPVILLPPPPIAERVPEVEPPPPPATPRLVPLPPSPPASPRRIALPPSPPASPHRIPLPPSPPTSPRRIAPPPSPSTILRRLRHGPLHPLPPRDAEVQVKGHRVVALLREKTALRVARNEVNPTEALEHNGMRERKARVRAVQRMIWMRLCELRGEAKVGEGERVA